MLDDSTEDGSAWQVRRTRHAGEAISHPQKLEFTNEPRERGGGIGMRKLCGLPLPPQTQCGMDKPRGQDEHEPRCDYRSCIPAIDIKHAHNQRHGRLPAELLCW